MRSVTLQVDDRHVTSGRTKSKGAPRKAPRSDKMGRVKIMRWPGALRSRAIRRATLAGGGVLLLAIAAALFPGKQISHQLLSWSGQAGYRVCYMFV